MQPFSIAESLNQLVGPYPSAKDIAAAYAKAALDGQYGIVRLWLSEGIPFAFQSCPAGFEAVRSWLANWLSVSPKEITLIGSARQGESLSPTEKFGKCFDDRSDLDFVAVSDDLFDRMREIFLGWTYDYEKGIVKPRNEREKKFWEANSAEGPASLLRGFIDNKRIPTFNRYPLAQRIAQAMYLIPQKLSCTPDAPAVREASIRVYRDWDSFIRQMTRSLDESIRYWRIKTFGRLDGIAS